MNTMKLFLVLSLLLTMSFNSLTKAEQGQGVRRLLKPRRGRKLLMEGLEHLPNEKLKKMGFSSEDINDKKTEAAGSLGITLEEYIAAQREHQQLEDKRLEMEDSEDSAEHAARFELQMSRKEYQEHIDAAELAEAIKLSIDPAISQKMMESQAPLATGNWYDEQLRRAKEEMPDSMLHLLRQNPELQAQMDRLRGGGHDGISPTKEPAKEEQKTMEIKE